MACLFGLDISIKHIVDIGGVRCYSWFHEWFWLDRGLWGNIGYFLGFGRVCRECLNICCLRRFAHLLSEGHLRFVLVCAFFVLSWLLF